MYISEEEYKKLAVEAPPKEKTMPCCIRLTDSDRERLVLLSKRYGVTQSKIVGQLIEQACKKIINEG